MRWSERVELVFSVFKRCWLIFYGWYLIFFLGAAFVLFMMILALMADIHIQQLLTGSLSPWDSFLYSANPLYIISRLVPILLTLVVLYSVAGGAFTAGVFNLSKKAYWERPTFRDFRFQGTLRVVGWNLIISLLGLLIIVIGSVIFFSFTNSSVGFLVMIIYGLLIAAVAIFLAPWLTTAVYYMLSQPHLSFASALSESFAFFYRNMGKLWGLMAVMLLFLAAIILIDHFSETLGSIAQLLYAPLGVIFPIVWVFSILEEEHHEINDL